MVGVPAPCGRWVRRAGAEVRTPGSGAVCSAGRSMRFASLRPKRSHRTLVGILGYLAVSTALVVWHTCVSNVSRNERRRSAPSPPYVVCDLSTIAGRHPSHRAGGRQEGRSSAHPGTGTGSGAVCSAGRSLRFVQQGATAPQ